MPITSAADRLIASLETKRLRRPWNPDLHPRDSKGRFIETGGIARLWGGGMARVLRSLGGRNVLVENLATRKRSTIHASRLTMVARPDGSAPTKSKRKVRDEDERRYGDQNRGLGYGEHAPDKDDDPDTEDHPATDPGDNGQTPDDPHDQDDEGNPIGDDVDGVDLGADPDDPEDDDDEPMVPQGRVMSRPDDSDEDPGRSAQDRGNHPLRDFPDLLPITTDNGGAGPESRRRRHVMGNGDALRADGPEVNKHYLQFWDTNHARRALRDLSNDYFEDLENAWPGEWGNSEADDVYNELADYLGGGEPFDLSDSPTDQADPTEFDRLSWFADDAERLAELAEQDGKEDVARYAQNLADALNLAHRRFQAHGKKPIPKPSKKRRKDQPLVPRAWRSDGTASTSYRMKPELTSGQPAAATPKARNKGGKRFANLNALQQHWQSGNLEPATSDKAAQQRHQKETAGLFAKLDKPQLSRRGTFVVAKMTVEKGGKPKTGYAVIVSGSGARLAMSERKGEAMEFANRLEVAQIDGEPFDWDSPGYHQRLESPEGQKMVRQAGEDAKKAFAEKAAKKKQGAAEKRTPAPATGQTSPAQPDASPAPDDAPERYWREAGGPRDYGNVREQWQERLAQTTDPTQKKWLEEALRSRQGAVAGDIAISYANSVDPRQGPDYVTLREVETGRPLPYATFNSSGDAITFLRSVSDPVMVNPDGSWKTPPGPERDRQWIELIANSKAIRARFARQWLAANGAPKPAIERPNPLVQAAQQLAQTTRGPANIGVGHIGPVRNKDNGDGFEKPSTTGQLRDYWKNGGDPALDDRTRDKLRAYAGREGWKITMSDHRGFAVIQTGPSDFEVVRAYDGHSLGWAGGAGGQFKTLNDANRFAMRLGAELEEPGRPGQPIDWWDPELYKRHPSRISGWKRDFGVLMDDIRGQYEIDAGREDTYWAQEYRKRQAERDAQQQSGNAPAQGAAPAPAAPEERPQQQMPQAQPERRDWSKVPREDLDAAYDAAVRAAVKTDDDAESYRHEVEGGKIVEEAERRDAETYSAQLSRVALGSVNDWGHIPVTIDGDSSDDATLRGGRGSWKWNRIGYRTRYSSDRTFLSREAAIAGLVRERDEEKAKAAREEADRAARAEERDLEKMAAETALQQQINEALQEAQKTLLPVINDLQRLHGDEAARELAYGSAEAAERFERGESTPSEAIEEFQRALDAIQRATRGLEGRDNMYVQKLMRLARDNVSAARKALADHNERNSGVRGSRPDVLENVPTQRGGGDGQQRGAGGVRPAAVGGDSRGNRGADGRVGAAPSGGDGRGGAGARAEIGTDAGSRASAARDGVRRGEGAGDGDEGHAAGGAAAPVGDDDTGPAAPTPSSTAAKWLQRVRNGAFPAFEPPADGATLAPSSPLNRAKANIAAIEILHRLQDEDRPPTADEQAELARYSGWGAVPQIFKPRPDAQFAPLAERLRELLTDTEWEDARSNTLNAHYTDPQIVQQVWAAVRDLGFENGEVLEPGSGIGNFIGYAPDGAQMTGVEVDPITARIAGALYPHSEIRHESFGDTRAPNGTFDMAIGNVPFGKYKVPDLVHNKGGHSIHNHFILKSLDLTRGGGLVAVVTSALTMDGHGGKAEAARMEMAEKAELVGAIRLPSGAHQRTAGTSVMTDLLIFRRRDKDKAFNSGRNRKGEIKRPSERSKEDPPMWVHSLPRFGLPGQADPETEGAQPVFYNSYFHDHPEQVLGKLAVGHGQHRDNELRVDGDGDTIANLARTLKRTVAAAKDAGLGYQAAPADRKKVTLLPPGSDRVDGHVQAEPDGTFTQVRDGMVHPFPVPKTQADEGRRLLAIRDTFQSLLAEESRKDADDSLIERLRAELNEQYQAYFDKYGAINRYTWAERNAIDPETGETVKKKYRKKAQRAGLFTKDPTMANISPLDEYDDITKKTTRAAIFTKRQGTYREIAEFADSPQDALAIVMEREGQLTADGLARVMDTDAEDAVAQLLAARSVDPDTGVEYPLAFQAPDGKLVMAADYLSGNVRVKLTAAREAAAENPAFDINVEHLERVIPPDLSTGEIAAPMGASWIGHEPVQQFLRETLGTDQIKVSWQGGSLWAVDAPDAVKKAVAFRTRDTWSAPGYDAIKLAEAILTNRKIVVTVKTREGSVFDPKATEDAKTKAELLKEAFTDWLWADPDRAEKYKRLYNDQFNSMAPRSYDGQRRTIPGLVEWFKPHPHQHAAVARMVNEPSVLLAHEVGAGKTAEMAMGVMELRRLGLVKKAALVVPGHMLDQFRQEFAEIFPESVANNRILTASSDDLAGKGRREFIARAAAGDYDAIIMTQTAFESIQMRPEVQETYIKRRLERLEAKIEAQKAIDGEDNDTRLVKRMETQLKTLREKLDKKLSGMKDAAGLHFEDMGIDYVVVDEAHMYKNLDTPSAIAAIDGSNRASDLEMKLEWLRERSTTGRVVTFATATPVANSIAEVHTMMRYLRPDLLEQLGLMDFDDFASTFGQMVSAVERSADGSYTEKVRLAAFQNVPELLRMWRAFADVKTSEDLDLPVPDIAGGKAITITMPMSEAQELYEEEIKRRAARLASGRVDPKEDNHLKLLGDGRMAALDPRLIDPEMGGGNKLPTVADNIVRIHEQTKDAVYPTSKTDPTPHPEKGGLQIVFLDLGTPKDPGKTKKRKKKAGDGEDVTEAADATDEDGEGYTDFSTYDELKQLLIARGIPSEKIRFIHEAKDDAAKARLFHEARTGKVSVLLGSTAKMGTGTNVQLRATALHHVDAPWRPADVEQRNGRVIRQGNANAEVVIFQYATERSTDAKFWEAIARKARFIRQLMRGSLNERVVEDIGEVKFDADEASALVAGDPHLIAQAQLRPIVKRLRSRYNAHQRSQEGFQRAIRDAELAEEQTTKLVATLQDAIAKRKPTRGEDFNARIGSTDFAGTEGREEARKALSAALRAVEADGRRRAYDPDEPPKIIGQVGGLDIAAKFSRAWNTYASRYDNGVRLELPAIPGSARTYESHQLVDVDGKPPRIPLQRIEDSIANLEAQVRRQEDMLSDKRRAAEQASARVGKPFELAEEFDKANRQLEILDEVMRLKAQPQSTEAAAAQQKASIDALDAEMRALVGEEEEDVLAQVSARDLDLTPKTPAPPSITQDDKGQVRFIWPTTEARDAERDKKLAAKRAEFEARFQQRQTNAPSQPDALTMDESELTSEVERLGGLIAREEASEADILRHAGLQREQKRRTRRKVRNQGQNPAGDAGTARTAEPTAEDTSTDAPETATDNNGDDQPEQPSADTGEAPATDATEQPDEAAPAPEANGGGYADVLTEEQQEFIREQSPAVFKGQAEGLHWIDSGAVTWPSSERLQFPEAERFGKEMRVNWATNNGLAHVVEDGGQNRLELTARGRAWMALADEMLSNPTEEQLHPDGSKRMTDRERENMGKPNMFKARMLRGLEAFDAGHVSFNQRGVHFRKGSTIGAREFNWAEGQGLVHLSQRGNRTLFELTDRGREMMEVLRGAVDRENNGESSADGTNPAPKADAGSAPETPAAAQPSPARERAPRNRERQQPAVRPFANDREWRQALAEVEATQGEITRAVEAAYGRGEEPGSARALRTAVFDAIAAQEAGDFDDATGGLAEAHEHAQRLRDELPSDVDAESLGRFMRVVDDYLARHAVTVEKRRRENEQRDRAEQQADAALRESLGLSPAPAP
ncbi:SNF2-related protein, partial [Streptomyces pseudogriseolus]|uniref:SNF2-related protein n=1 Tax=Streptomyces pseudogriseolus TaxID=36817 RepID=UPI000A3BB738